MTAEQLDRKRAYQREWVRAKRQRDPDYAQREVNRHSVYRASLAGGLAQMRRNHLRRWARIAAHEARSS